MATQFALFKCPPGDQRYSPSAFVFNTNTLQQPLGPTKQQVGQGCASEFPSLLDLLPSLKIHLNQQFACVCMKPACNDPGCGQGLHHQQPSLMENHTIPRALKVNYTFLSRAHVPSNLTHKTRENNTLRARETISDTALHVGAQSMSMWFQA